MELVLGALKVGCNPQPKTLFGAYLFNKELWNLQRTKGMPGLRRKKERERERERERGREREGGWERDGERERERERHTHTHTHTRAP